jgi:hypothetical protein
MTRLKIIVVFGSKPNFDKDAFKYFFLSLNKLQNTYEFCFPDLVGFPFEEQVCVFETANHKIENFVSSQPKDYAHIIGIITITAVWQNGGFSAKLNIWFSNKV